MGKNRNTHKTKKNKVDNPFTNTIGDFMKAQGINLRSLKSKLKNDKKEINQATI